MLSYNEDKLFKCHTCVFLTDNWAQDSTQEIFNKSGRKCYTNIQCGMYYLKTLCLLIDFRLV